MRSNFQVVGIYDCETQSLNQLDKYCGPSTTSNWETRFLLWPDLVVWPMVTWDWKFYTTCLIQFLADPEKRQPRFSLSAKTRWRQILPPGPHPPIRVLNINFPILGGREGDGSNKSLHGICVTALFGDCFCAFRDDRGSLIIAFQASHQWCLGGALLHAREAAYQLLPCHRACNTDELPVRKLRRFFQMMSLDTCRISEGNPAISLICEVINRMKHLREIFATVRATWEKSQCDSFGEF